MMLLKGEQNCEGGGRNFLLMKFEAILMYAKNADEM